MNWSGAEISSSLTAGNSLRSNEKIRMPAIVNLFQRYSTSSGENTGRNGTTEKVPVVCLLPVVGCRQIKNTYQVRDRFVSSRVQSLMKFKMIENIPVRYVLSVDTTDSKHDPAKDYQYQ